MRALAAATTRISSSRNGGVSSKRWRKRVPNAPFAGPDTAFNNDWLVPFAKAFRNDVKFVSSHYYAEGPPSDPAMDIPRLLRPDPKL